MFSAEFWEAAMEQRAISYIIDSDLYASRFVKYVVNIC